MTLWNYSSKCIHTPKGTDVPWSKSVLPHMHVALIISSVATAAAMVRWSSEGSSLNTAWVFPHAASKLMVWHTDFNENPSLGKHVLGTFYDATSIAKTQGLSLNWFNQVWRDYSSICSRPVISLHTVRVNETLIHAECANYCRAHTFPNVWRSSWQWNASAFHLWSLSFFSFSPAGR